MVPARPRRSCPSAAAAAQGGRSAREEALGQLFQAEHAEQCGEALGGALARAVGLAPGDDQLVPSAEVYDALTPEQRAEKLPELKDPASWRASWNGFTAPPVIFEWPPLT